ncbi:MAG TPA: carboxypeptidase-like regulatory domain-containing protein [Gemmataceae bacterium]|nr:carboxypeptidase-like regulatory domain-containing protein [Gemmataceae bacterium]
MVSCRERGNERPGLRLACCCLSIGLMTAMAGCGNHPRSVEHVDVSGQVFFEGSPLPGGQVSFVAVNGGFAAPGIIDENGHYQIRAPVGEVEIGVSNRMLQGNGGLGGGGGPEGMSPRQKKAKGQPVQRVKGRWVNIPAAYADPHTSGLKYTVKPGPQTYDIKLSASGPPPAGAPGS